MLQISLNYDLTVYWAMLEGNNQYGKWFKDCFVERGSFDVNWKRFRTPYGNASRSTLVFYPHGNLALATSLTGGESKIIRENSYDSLLNRILVTWEQGKKFPLFVSEGDNRQKELAILRSAYLQTVYNSVLPTLGPTFAVYGWSFRDADDHILRRICESNARKIAVSVYLGGRSIQDRDIQDRCQLIKSKIEKLNRSIELFFFDAESSACWIHP